MPGCRSPLVTGSGRLLEPHTHRAASGPVLDEDERGELERLRGEVAALRAAPAPRRARIRWALLAAAFLLVLGCVGVVTGAVVGSLGSAHWGWRARRSWPSPCRAWFSLFWRCGCMIIEAFRSRRGGREAAAMLLRERSALGAVVGGALKLIMPTTTRTWVCNCSACPTPCAPCSQSSTECTDSLLSQLRHAVWRSGGCDCQSV